jgi:hypothetical protein
MKEVYGNWQMPNGSPAAGATVTFRLSQDAAAEDGSGLLGKYPIEVTLDDDGALPISGSLEGMLLECNDEILPAGTYYVVDVQDPEFGTVYHARLSIVGMSPINLNLITPIS